MMSFLRKQESRINKYLEIFICPIPCKKHYMKHHFLGSKDNNKKLYQGAVVRGMLERFVIYVGLINQFPQIIIAFAALKLGTRLREEQDNKITNSYFLTGNLTSILFAIIYAIIFVTVLSWSKQQ